MAKVTNVIHKTGKRKTSVARATLKKGSGKMIVNNQELDSYTTSNLVQLKIKEPLVLSGEQNSYDVKVNVFGGGQNSQAEAIRQAIARALVEGSSKSEELRKQFLEYDRSLLVSDTRFKEMKKPNNSHARAKRQKSYR